MSEWISVEDRLPEDDDNQLKIIKYGKDGRHIGIDLSRMFILYNQS